MNSVLKECPYGCVLIFWGRYVSVHADESDTVAALVHVYKHFVVQQTENTDLECCILRKYSGCQSPAFFVNGLFYQLPDTERFLDHAELILFRHLFDLLDDYIVLHAGVVERKGRALVVYGQSGFGKTTLTLELLRRGYGFLSDEFCPIRLSDFLIEPFERLVSIKKTSSVLGLIDAERTPVLRFGSKNFFDCADTDRTHAAQPCRAGAFIEISGTVDCDVCPSGGAMLDIYLCNAASSVPEALRDLPGVTLSGPVMQGRYATYRVTASDGTAFVSRFNSIWTQYSHDIFSVLPYRGVVSSFERTPVLQRVTTFEAVTSIMSNIVNRSPTGRLLESFAGKNASLTMLLGRMLTDITCYRVQPGHLDMMGDLIDTINY